jgi:hypothetical protein
MQIKNKVQQ